MVFLGEVYAQDSSLLSMNGSSYTMKRLLVLGGGIYQAPMIKRARELGYWVAAASLSKNDPGMQYAHEAWEVNLVDHEAVLALVEQNAIDAVTTTGTEFSIPTIGLISDRLGLPGISLETSKLSTNKILAQQRFAEFEVPTARFRRVASLADALAAANEIGYPVFVKAPDSSGSRGISMVADASLMEASFDEGMTVSRSGAVLVEKMLTGVEFGAQAIVIDGEVEYCLCHNDTVTPPPVTVPVGHSLPFTLGDKIVQESKDVCARAAHALGIENAVCNVDLIATKDGVRLFEIGARIGATGIAEITNLHYGVNLYDVAISLAFGERPEIKLSEGVATAYCVLMAKQNGSLRALSVPDDIRADDRILDTTFDYSVGDTVRAFRTGPDRIGHVFVRAESMDAAEALCLDTASRLEITIT